MRREKLYARTSWEKSRLGYRPSVGEVLFGGSVVKEVGEHWSNQPAGQSGWWIKVTSQETAYDKEMREQAERERKCQSV